MAPPTAPFQPYAKEHADTQGAGDARPTALQIIDNEGLVGQLSDKVMIITGCSAGLGIETARALHATGARLFLTVRDKAKGEAVIQDLIKTGQGKGSIELLLMDLSDLSSVRTAAADFLARSEQLNVLIANAGVAACAESKTADGFELQMGTNHFGHFLFFQLLKPALLQSSTSAFQSRVVTVASSSHRMQAVRFDDMDFAREGYNKWLAYGQSKTANIYLANSIERHYGARGLHGYSLNPGAVFETDAFRHMTAEDYASFGPMEPFLKIAKSVGQGAATQVWAAVSAHLEGKGGLYLDDVGEAGLTPEDATMAAPGYGPHAYDEAAAEKLWALSYGAVGLVDED
ncbi:hypothetical protein LTR08_002200 [Meristemomyces frigidus]|nr:hypothetical protein LTR08_002200 [Meristemomyces frigidus]